MSIWIVMIIVAVTIVICYAVRITVRICRNAPMAYEDEKGFHIIEESPGKRPRKVLSERSLG